MAWDFRIQNVHVTGTEGALAGKRHSSFKIVVLSPGTSKVIDAGSLDPHILHLVKTSESKISCRLIFC